MENLFLVIIFGFLTNLSNCGSLDEPCFGCQLFNIKDKEQKSRRAIEHKCPRVCSCQNKHLKCEDGVPVLIDGCGCCYMCARQYGDACSSVDRCDTAKGLYCDIQPDAQHGVCRADNPKRCLVNGISYGDGDSFNLDCRNHCTCQNGHYGCVDLCSQEHRKPSDAFCPNARLMTVRGQCCKEWNCMTSNKTESNKMPRHIASNYELRPQNNPRWHSQQINEVIQTGNDCVSNGTKWSQCSVSCGVGISVRMAPKHCRKKEDTRLCYIRPCGKVLYSNSRKKKCTPTTRSVQRERITYKDCKSVRGYRLKFCTNCKNKQCCYPKRTKTREIEFLCNDGRYEYLKYVWIKRCKCSKKCKNMEKYQ